MKVQHSFELPADFERSWSLLNQVDQLVSCLPGATATKTDDDHFAGSLRVRMGPLDMTFKGTIEFVERDHAAGRLVLRSKGNEMRGQGSASATTVARFSKLDCGTRVDLDTDFMIAGRVAQMGRGMIVEVSNDLLDRFVSNLKSQRIATTPVDAAARHPGSPEAAAGESKNDGLYLSGGSIIWRILKKRLGSLFRVSSADSSVNRS
jgi:carbon monoxide dehydrogenase subunit G